MTELIKSLGKPVETILLFTETRPVYTSKNGKIYRLNNTFSPEIASARDHAWNMIKDLELGKVYGCTGGESEFILAIDPVAKVLLLRNKKFEEGIFWHLK